jgi:hypothetical protein
MNCDECRELLSEFIDERLPGETAAAVAAHLDECAKCSELETELRTTVSLLTGLERQAPEVDIAAAVQARLERQLLIAEPAPRSARAHLTPWRFAGIGAAAAAVVLAALYIWMPPATNQITPPEAAQPLYSRGAHGIAPETIPQGAPSALRPSAPVQPQPEAAKPMAAAGASPAGSAGREANTTLAFSKPTEGGAALAAKPASLAKGAAAHTEEKAALRLDSGSTAVADRAEKRAARLEERAATATSAAPNAASADELKRARSAGGLKADSAGVAGEAPAAKTPSEMARKDKDFDKMRSLGYLDDAEARSKSKAEVAQAPPAPLAYGLYAGEEVQAKKDAAPAVATYYFEGKSSDVALQFLALLPDGKKPLPQATDDLDALKAAAADRNASLIEFSDARVVLDYSATPADDAKIVAALASKSGLMRQVVLSTVASVTDEKHMSQAEAPLSTQLKKENPQLAAAKEESRLSNAEPVLKGQIAAENEFGAVAAGKGAAKYRVIFLRKPVAPVAPAAPATPPAAPGS